MKILKLPTFCSRVFLLAVAGLPYLPTCLLPFRSAFSLEVFRVAICVAYFAAARLLSARSWVIYQESVGQLYGLNKSLKGFHIS